MSKPTRKGGVPEAPSVQRPTVGRIVHYTSAEDQNVPLISHAGIVINVRSGMGEGFVDLKVWFQAGNENQKMQVPFAEKPTPGHWNWPPRD